MTEYYYGPNLVGSVAIGDQQLTDFYNGKAELVNGDLKAMDEVLSLQITHQRVDTERVPHGSTYVKSVEKGIPQCKFTLRMRAQTGEPLHWLTNQCDTTGPAGSTYTHGMDCIYNVPTAALWLAFYFENETSTNAKEYFGLLGVTVDSVELVADTNNFPCEWVVTGKAAYEKFAHSALTEVAFNSDSQFMWHHGTFTFTYNSNAVGLTITSVKFSCKNTWLEGPRDSGKYVSAMTLIRSEPVIEVTGWRYYTAAADPIVICRTAPSSYAGDLYFKILLARTANEDEIAIIIDKCEAQASDRNIDRAATGIEPLVMTLEPYESWDTTDYIIVKDTQDETQYENNGA